MPDLFDRDRELRPIYGPYARPGIARIEKPLTPSLIQHRQRVRNAAKKNRANHAAKQALKTLGW